jgi:hypothetical protein
MKVQANFLIKHYEYFGEKGNLLNEYYYIQEWKRFLWWSYWKDIKYEVCEYGDCYKVRLRFKTLKEAQHFVKNVLCPELPRDSCKETVVDEMVCKNGESK